MKKFYSIFRLLSLAAWLLCIPVMLANAGNSPGGSFSTPQAGNGLPADPKAPESVVVGTSTETNYNTPYYPYYGYSFTQTLYLQPELNFSGKVITQIGYAYAGPNNDVQAEIEIYLGHTSLTEITSSVPLATFTKVYDGPYNSNAGGDFKMVEINPFYYNNADNLIVTFIEKKPGWTSPSDVFYSTATDDPLCIGQWNDGSAYDPNSLPSGYPINYRANTMFTIDNVPTGPPVSVINPLSLSFGDVETGQSKVMTVQIKNGGADPLTITGFVTSDEQFQVINTTFPLQLGMNESEIVQIQYAPAATGYADGKVTFLMDEAIEGDREVQVSGKGLFLQAVIIGDGTELSSNTPVYPWYGFSFTQTLYFQSEINMAGRTINRIGYQYGGSNLNLDFMIEIYLGHTSMASISQSVPLNGFTKVYDGPYIVRAGEEFSWVEIDPFFYNNSDNLLVTIIEKKPGYTSSSDKFFATTSPGGQNLCIGAWNDGAAYDPANLPSGSVISMRANTKLWFSGDVPTEPEAKTTPPALYFGEVETTVAKVMNVEVMNAGGGVLEITGATITNPAFTVINATFPVNLTIGQKKTFEIQFLPLNPGLEEALLTFEMDASVPGSKTVELSGRALRFGVLRESFEGTLFPPLGWKLIDNNKDGKGWLRNTGFVPTGQTGPRTGVACASLDVYAGSPGETSYDDWLITPQMIWQDGDLFKFFVKRVADQSGQTWRVFLSTSGSDVTDFVPIDEITNPPLSYMEKMYDLSEYGVFPGDMYYIGIQFNSLWCWPGVIDDVLGSVMNRFDNDLMAISLTGNDIVYLNNTANYQVKIANYGNLAAAGSDYSIGVFAYVGGVETQLGSVPGVNLAQGELAEFTIPVTFTQTGVFDLYAKIVWPADMNQTNNITGQLQAEAIPASVVVKNIGDFPIDNETDYYYQYPVNFADMWRSTSLSECLYFKHELNTGGIIERLTYYRNFTESMNNRKIKIWMGETDTYSLEGNYIPPSQMKLVFDDKVSIPEGIGKVNFELSDPFVYTGNGNLVVNVYYYDGGSYSEGATFAYTEDYSYYRTTYDNGWSVINPENPSYMGTQTNYPNTSLMFETGNGLGQLNGYVYYQADNTPVTGAKIEIFNPAFPAVKTEIYSDASGYYNAPYALAGNNMTVTVSKFGYSDVKYTNVNLAGGGSVYLGTAYLVDRPTIALSGSVIKSDNLEPARFATVKLAGLENYETTTEVTGEFFFPEIWGDTDYQIEVSLDGYQTYSATITVPGTDFVLDPITILENAPSPNLVNAVVDGDNALVTWYAAGQPYPMDFRYDDGNVSGVLITPGNATIFTGSAWPNDAIINQVHFYNYVHENYPSSPEVRVLFLGLNPDGSPNVNDQLALFENVENRDGWNTFNLPAPVNATGGFFVSIAGYTNFTTIAYDDGEGAPYEWQPRTQWGNGLGNYNPLENGTSPPLRGNILVRASGLTFGDTKAFEPLASLVKVQITEPSVMSLCTPVQPFAAGDPDIRNTYKPTELPKSFMHYNVYRKPAGNDPWTAVSAEPVNDTSYLDITWNALEFGLYYYGVEAEYTNGVKSKMAVSNIIEKDMRITLNLTVNTNTGIPGMSEGAVVTLINQNGDINHIYTGTVGADETALLENVLKGAYTLEIKKPGFNDYSEAGVDLFIPGLNTEKTVEITEYIYDPYDLNVNTSGQLAGSALFRWNLEPVFDNVDSYEPFLINNIGGWKVVDQDGKPTVSINGIDFPHMGEPFSFITLNRSLTTPPLSEAYWGGHSGNQYFAAFASATGSTSNWLISPEQNHTLPFTLSFYAKGVNDLYGAETFRIAYSTSGTNLSDFVYITGEVSTLTFWTFFKYTIPADARYVAIRHTHTGFALLVDDILLGVEADNSLPGNGFTVYLDGNEVETGLMSNLHTYKNVLPGTHTAGVKASFYTGESAIVETVFEMQAGTALNFLVQDDKGVMLDDAEIKLLYNGTEVLTMYTLNGMASAEVVPGTWQYTVSKDDLIPVAGEVIAAGSQVDIEVILNHYYTLTFKVSDESGNPVQDAVVSFRLQNKNTDVTGMVSYISEPGVFPYSVNHPDFNRVLAMVELTDDQEELVILGALTCELPVNLAGTQYFNNINLTWEPPVSGTGGAWLHWDVAHEGVSIGTGGAVDFDVAQRFEPADLAAHHGKFLTRITFVPHQEQCTYSVRVWTGGNIAEPEILVVDQVVTNPVMGQWNEILLNTPVYVDAGKELWFGVRNNTTTGYPAGCDVGPAVDGKGNMINLAGTGWITLLQANSTLNYNWSVRGLLEEIPGKAMPEIIVLKDVERGSFTGKLSEMAHPAENGFSDPRWLLGYNLYRNDELINAELLTGLDYADNTLPLGTFDYHVTAVYSNGCESDYSNKVTVDVTERLGQQIPLNLGWQIISTYNIPDYPEFPEMFSHQLQNNSLEVILGKTGIFWPGQNINMLGNWDTYQAYKLKMNANDNLNIGGELVTSRTVNLSAGLSYLPVLSTDIVNAMEIFDQLGGSLIFAFEIANGLIYWPGGGIYTLEKLEPGYGYLVYLLTPGSVTFPDYKTVYNNPGNKVNSIHEAPWSLHRSDVAHIISVYANALNDLTPGDIIGAFNSQGICVGMAVIENMNTNLGLVVYADDFTTLESDGMRQAERMNFRIYHPSSSTETDVVPVWDLSMPDHGQFAENGLSAISRFKLGSTGIGEPGITGVSVYPNPASDIVTVQAITSGGFMTEITDEPGNILISRKFTGVKGIIDVSKLAPGFYTIRITGDNDIPVSKKLIIQ